MLGNDSSKLDTLRSQILTGRGEIPCDLVLKNAYLIDVFTGDIHLTDIAIHGDRIVGIGRGYEGRDTVELRGSYVCPGFIDAHFHIESTMLLPSILSKYLLMNGTTCVVSDPHEIANVLGIKGVLGIINDSQNAVMDFYFTAPSCVPATALETSGSAITPMELTLLSKEPKIVGLSEVMDTHAVINAEPTMLQKLLVFRARHGHAPTMAGKELMAYLSAGIDSDHETIGYKEGLEKLRAGMFLMIREGSTAKNLEELLPLITQSTYMRICFVSDDLDPSDLLMEGHLNRILRKAVALGLDPVTAVRLVTISPATYLGFVDRLGIGPGRIADMVILEDLNSFNVRGMVKSGKYLDRDALRSMEIHSLPVEYLKKGINLGELSLERLRIRAKGRSIRVIEMVPNQVITRQLVVEALVEEGYVVSDTSRDLSKLVVAERHRGSGNLGIGFVKGFGLREGALATTIAHDSHNIVCVGTRDEDILKAILRLKELGGGIVVVNGRVLAELPLPYAGLMTHMKIERLTDLLNNLHRSAKECGISLPSPFMTLSFLALPVIPYLKLTDKGLVDVMEGKIVDLFV